MLQRSYHMVRELGERHDLDLVAFVQPALMEPMFTSLQEALEQSEKHLKQYCRSVRFVPIDAVQGRFGRLGLAAKSLFSSRPYTIGWLRSRAFEDIVADMLAKNDYDVVHFDTISLAPYRRLVEDTPCVLDHHNVESQLLARRAENERNPLKSWYFRQEGVRLEEYEQKVCSQFTLNLLCSEMDEDRLQAIAPNCRMEVVPNGVDAEYFYPATTATSGERSLIFAGRLNWYPNTQAVRFIALELWPVLKKAIPDIKVDIVGANPPEDVVECARKESDIRVHGFVDDVRTYIANASIYICPITDGGGTKLKVLDALAMAKPLVAHPIACEGIAVKDGHNVRFAASVQDYVDAIRELLNSPHAMKCLGARGREMIESRYCYSKIGEQLSCLYQEITTPAGG